MFYPFEHILGTLLHELTHMSIGPHNSQFYALLDVLWTEAEKFDYNSTGLKSNFIPFEGKSYKLGGHAPTSSSLSANSSDARKKAAAAALKRNSKGHILGGSRIDSGKPVTKESIREACAAAAERRRFDAISCGAEEPSERDTEEEIPVIKSSNAINKRSSSVIEVVDLTDSPILCKRARPI